MGGKHWVRMKFSFTSKQSQECQGHRPQALQAKEKLHLQRHQQAQGTQECQVHHEDLERLQDHEHQWDQLHPGRDREGMKTGTQTSRGPAVCTHRKAES